ADPAGSGVREGPGPLDSVLRPGGARLGDPRRDSEPPGVEAGAAGGAVRAAVVDRLVDRGWPAPLAEAPLSARVVLATVAVLLLAGGVGLWWTAVGRAPAPAVAGVAEGEATSFAGDTAARSRSHLDTDPAAGVTGTTT